MRPSVSITLDKRRMSTTGDNAGKYPIKIKVNFKVREGNKNRYVVRRYPTGVFCKPSEYAKKQRDYAVIMAHAKAIELFQKGFSVIDFERMYTGSGSLEDIKTTFDYVIKGLREQERDGTAGKYAEALRSFIKYKGEYIAFGSITPEWLKGYERWMIKDRMDGEVLIKGRSITTVGMNCRALRAIYNTAIDLRIISRDVFPFGLRKYVIPTGRRTVKKAFSREEKNLILSYRSSSPAVNRALDIWVYQYLSSGCNMADVAYLQFKNIIGDFLTFDRKKTENTERNKQSIEVHITERMREVIARHGNKSLDPDAYVFPILRPGITSKKRKQLIHDFIGEINDLLAVAQAEINKDGVRLSVKLTTGTARYTAATLLKRGGIDLAVIAKALGHGSEATTENYTEDSKETQMLISKALLN